jgi:hypothetical protein
MVAFAAAGVLAADPNWHTSSEEKAYDQAGFFCLLNSRCYAEVGEPECWASASVLTVNAQLF